jgi:serine/threonine protein kinase
VTRAPPGYTLGPAFAEDRTGVLYRAVQTSLGRPVTLKLLPDGRAQDRDAIALFVREISIVAALEHPNLLLAVDTGTLDGAPFLVTESTAEPTLADALRAGDPLPESRASLIALGVARALRHLESARLLYKNLRPSNILLPRPAAPKLVTFRNVRSIAEAEAFRRSNVQSAAYCAPELVRADLGPVTIRANVYALGAVLYHMAAGRPPVDGPSADVRRAHALGRVPPLRSVAGGLGPKLYAVVERLMHPDPAKRPDPAAAVALLEALSREPRLPPPRRRRP